jgi:MSHA biogenesis protein MshJ
MNKLQQRWLNWSEQFIELTQREKIIILFAAVFLTGFAVFKLQIEPRLEDMEQLEKRSKTVSSQLLSTNSQIAEINSALQVDPNEKIKKEIAIIRAEITKLESDLDKVMTEYIAPERMASALTRLLKGVEGVRIVGLTALRPEMIQHNSDLNLPSYYRHRFELEVEGDYFSLMKFVRTVSVNNKQFSVQDLHYQVEEHPTALMKLSLFTIGDNEKVIRL